MKRLTSILAFLAVTFSAYAQTSIKVQVPNMVALDEQFNVTFIIEGESAPDNFSWTPGNDFQLVWGPQKGSSTSISIINGKHTKSSQTTFTYILKPTKAGKFQLEAASALVGKEQLYSRRASVEVVSGGAQSSAQQPSSQGPGQAHTGSSQSSSQSSSSADDIFLRMSFSKTRAVVGETITATLKLYQRVNIAGFENAKFPAFDGFWSQESAPSNLQFTRENVNDRIYESAVIRTWTLIPQHAGELRVEPAELTAIINVRTPRASTGSIFDSFFQDDYRQVRKALSTPAVDIHVSGLPAGAPASFCGGVGNFKMSVNLTRDSLKTHDAASLKVTVTGRGNLSMISAPKVNFPPDFEVYDTKTVDGAGSKTFEYPFIPRSYGDFEIPPVEYSYYDIAAGKYVTLTGQPLLISVAKGNETVQETPSGVPSGVIRKDVKDLGSDIRFIKAEPGSLDEAGSFFTGSAAYWTILALLLAAAVAVWLAVRKMSERRADVVGSRGRAATKMARKRLSQAGVYLKGDLHTAFYEELHKALLGFVSDKLNMDAADMSRENIASRLCESGAGEALSKDFTDLLEACEFARYAPDSGHEAMNSHFESAVSTISAIDEKMKHKPRISSSAAVALLLLVFPLSGMAGNREVTDSLWNAASSAYASGQWKDAADAWTAIAGMGLESADLYYNLGNACFKADRLGYAVLNYEKALKIDPSHKDAAFNLEFVNSLCQDRIETVPEFFLKTWTRKLCWTLRSDAWAALSLVLLALALAMLLLFLLSSGTAARKAGFFTAVVAFLLTIVCISFAFWQKNDYKTVDSAVVTRSVSSVKSSPGNELSTDLFVLHEGTKVNLLDSVGDWTRIELADGRQGWIKNTEIVEI